ncbi:MAG: hypothetical protein OXF26_10610 [Alphaproteobacteria bacterium]|nr:hypothetical protein [Alphaproteobacteria bacterium]MCY4231299.1 hypothetical protein [Alphaproteobacteria bacterium]
MPHRKAQATELVRRFRGFLCLRQDCRCDNGGALVAKHPPQQFDCLPALTVVSHRPEVPFQQGAHGEGRGRFAAGMHVACSRLYGAGEAALLPCIQHHAMAYPRRPGYPHRPRPH